MFSTGRTKARRARRTTTTTHRSAVGLLLGMGLIGALLALAPVVVPTAEAYSNSTATFSGQGCNGDNSVGTWGSVTVPANAVSFTFTITGAGGSGGDNNAGSGGRGGRGAIVTATVPVTAGQVLWAKIGCGGREGGTADGYTTGPGISNLAGGGGGSSVMCIGSATGSCGGGTVVAIAAGGGGGGRGSGTGACSDKTGGGGGDAGNSGSATSGSGTVYNGFGGGDGQGTPQAFGGGAGTANGGGGGGGQGAGSAGGGANTNLPNGSGNGGSGNSGKDSIQAGGGGGGYAGGGGGGGGEDGNCTFGNWASAGGGGGGSSWVRNTASGIGVSTATFLGGCTAGAINSNAGGAASQGNQSWGCGGGLSNTSFSIGNPPTGSGQTTGNATKGVALAIALANADLDGNNRTCQIVTSPTKGGVTLSGGAPGTNCSASYTANANTSGNDSFTYRLVDTDGLIGPTYTVTIPIVNRAPVGAGLAAPGTTINKGAATNFALTNTDPDGDSPLTCAITVQPTKATIPVNTSCTKAVTPNANTIGADSFTYTVSDAYSGTSTTYVVNFTIANRNPTGANQTLSVDAGTALPITLANTDLDLVDTLTCATSNGPTKGALTGTGCSRTYTSNAGTANNGVGGSDSFQYTPQDQNGGAGATQTISLTINNPNLSLAKAHTGRFQPGTGTGTYTLTIGNTTAVANGTTTITDTLPAGMKYRSFSAGSSGFTCTGTAGVSTTVTCTRATAIPVGFSNNTLTISVDVAENAATPVSNVAVITSLYELSTTAANNTATDATSINIRPVANNVTAATDVDTPTAVAFSATDANGDTLAYTVVASPLNGTLSGSGASRQYSPDTGFQGIDTFTYRVTDNEGLVSNTATVSVYVGVSRFTGTVTNEVGGAALSGITVFLVDNSVPSNPDPALVATATTNGAGAYDFASQFPSLGAVPHGNYVVRFYDPTNNFISEYNLNSPNRAGATNVAVNASSPTIALDAVLTPGARIQGTVRSAAGGNPTINGIQVRLFKIGTAGSKAATTAGAGQYKHELLTAGTYQLWFRDVNSGQWYSEWYDEQATQAASTTVTLTVGQQLIINEDLVPIVAPPAPTTGTVTGTVRSAGVGNAPLAGIQVRLYSGPTYESSAATTTDANGTYTFTDVLSGSYKLWFRVVQGSAYASEYYDDQPDLASAGVVNVTIGTVVADALLTPTPPPPAPNSGVVSGTVTETDGVTPIAGLQVRLYVEGVATGSVAATTDALGHYSFTGRAPGSYQVWFRDLGTSFFSEWYDDQASQAAATAVPVTNNTTATVNASLTHR